MIRQAVSRSQRAFQRRFYHPNSAARNGTSARTSSSNDNTPLQYLAYAAFMATATTHVALNEHDASAQQLLTPPSNPQERLELLLEAAAASDDHSSFVRQCHEQGPCRALWNDLQECASSVQNNKRTLSKKCAAPAQALAACWQKHPNLYVLIGLAVHQETVRAREMELAEQPRVGWSATQQPQIDFSSWNKFIAAANDQRHQFVEWLSLDKTVPLWQRFDIANEGDPTLVPATTLVPTTTTAPNHGRLTCCYALDQDNLVIGFAEVISESQQPQHRLLQISVLPAQTKTIRVLGFYENTKKQVTLYESPPFRVPHSLAPADQS